MIIKNPTSAKKNTQNFRLTMWMNFLIKLNTAKDSLN